MPSIWKVGERDDSLTAEVFDNSGTVELRVNGTKVLSAQQAAVADAAAATAAATTSGAVTVTSAAATDLGTFSAAMVADVADIRTQLNAALQELRDHGLIAT